MTFQVDIANNIPLRLGVRLLSGKTSVETPYRAVYAEHFLSIGISPEKKSG
jgi:hypothetical protein